MTKFWGATAAEEKEWRGVETRKIALNLKTKLANREAYIPSSLGVYSLLLGYGFCIKKSLKSTPGHFRKLLWCPHKGWRTRGWEFRQKCSLG